MESEFVLYRRQVPNIEEEIKKIIELADVGRGWTYVSSTDNVNYYVQKSDRSPFNYILGEGIVHTTTETLLQYIQNPNTTEIDPSLILREEIVRLSDTSRVMRLRYKFPAFLSDREFVVHTYDGIVSDNPKIGVCAGISIDHEMCKEVPEFVRGIMLTSGYVCKEITTNPARTHVAYVVQFDPKGWIPAIVVNLIASEQASNVLRLKKYFERSIITEQTYKFPTQLQRTVDSAQDTAVTDGEDTTDNENNGPNLPQTWHEEDLSDGQESERKAGGLFDLLDTEQDKEDKETLLDPTTTPNASRLIQNFFA